MPNEGEPGSKEQEFRELVLAKMIHGPCGDGYSANLSCRKTFGLYGQCKKKYPKSFNPSTLIVDDAYPMYRRRSPQDGGNVGYKFVRGVRRTIDNRWVVPYSPYLILKYGCHCNLEFCNSIRQVKYLFKYQMKGGDMVTIQLPGGDKFRDEVREYTHK